MPTKIDHFIGIALMLMFVAAYIYLVNRQRKQIAKEK